MSDTEIFFVGLFVSGLVCYTVGLLRTIDNGIQESEVKQRKAAKKSTENATVT